MLELCFSLLPFNGAALMVAEISRKEKTMSKYIPECPQFPTLLVAGVEHLLTPSPKRLDDFLDPALHAAGMTHWHDGGAVEDLMPFMADWWPEPPCPVETHVMDDETGESHPRWHTRYGRVDEAALLAAYPQDADQLRIYFNWLRQCKERTDALHAARASIEALGKLRRRHVLQGVVAEIESQLPGFVGQLVSAHCADGHVCSMAEHDAQTMV